MGGKGGSGSQKFCAPQMARPDCPFHKFRFFPRSLWSGGGGGGGAGGAPTVVGPSNVSLPPEKLGEAASKAERGPRGRYAGAVGA